ncbi:uncharacterized protein BKA55DRAFT_541149 [Fusarium redolens]|uniref:Uncharacterized protein n=1 Tax=Fusarium redolens TaxID=48865 RepID=A0A9P9GU80_FUSRE|nr:uncharacterized protein BKA55DRAFT_541149 [Fusarium redolens]KAH7244237.1 hypothetical protein BKA55DRAFT_541149 [Fusarium redolens]
MHSRVENKQLKVPSNPKSEDKEETSSPPVEGPDVAPKTTQTPSVPISTSSTGDQAPSTQDEGSSIELEGLEAPPNTRYPSTDLQKGDSDEKVQDNDQSGSGNGDGDGNSNNNEENDSEPHNVAEARTRPSSWPLLKVWLKGN